MSAPDLPADLSQWPEDSHELLGVPFDIDPRELKRVYTRLIRVWKPEQFPEHFRRIRVAYENVLQRVQFFQQFRSQREPAEDEPPATAPPRSLDEEPQQPPAPPRDSLDVETEADRQWQRACTGEEASYARLVELHQQRPRHPALCIRLYWLLALSPELDGSRVPCDWLVQGLLGEGYAGALRELYRREIVRTPAEAVSERCNQLLQSLTKPAELSDLVEWRWPAAVQLDQWRIIDDDLELLHDRLARDDDEVWIRLVVSAAVQLCSVLDPRARELAKECQTQIEQHDHLHHRLRDELDHLEVVAEAADQLLRLRDRHSLPTGLLRLIAQSWTRPFSDLRTPLLQYLAPWPRDPTKPLRQLDELRTHDGEMVLMQFGNLLALLENSIYDDHDPRTPEQLTALARSFLDEHDWRTYEALRPVLLAFCVREFVRPDVILNQLAGTALGQWLNADAPLQYVCWACRLVGG